MVNHNKTSMFDIVNALFMGFIILIMAYPFIYMISISFSDTSYILQNKVSFFPRGFNINAYTMIFGSPKIPRAYMNTVIYTSVGAFINVLFTAVTAYPLSKKGMIGRKYVMMLIIFTMFFNGGIIPNYILVKNLGLIDSIWAIVIPNAIWTYELLILKSFYENLASEIYESAIIDGASEFRILFRIFMPLAKPAIASITLFYAMRHWNSFFIPMIYLNDLNKLPLQVVLKEMLIQDTAKASSNLSEYASLTPEALKNATIVISTVPMLLLYPYIQRFFVKGIMLGAVKG